MNEEQAAPVPAASEGNAAPVASTPVETPPSLWEPNSVEAKMAEVFDRLNPQDRVNRSETGQFESKAPAAPEDQTPNEQGQAQTEVKTEPAAPAIAHPQSLPAELRDKWGTAAPELAEWISKREAESHKRITELGETAKYAEQMRPVIDRFRSSVRGQSDAQAVEKLFVANEYLERDPVAGLQWLAQAYGVNLSQLVQQVDQAQQGEPEGAYRALQAEIANLKRQLADTSNRVMTREQREEQARQESLAKLVEDFAKDKEYWKDLEDDVLGQVQAVRAREPNLTPEAILKKAHDQALRINEAVANKLSEAQRKADEAKAEADKKRKADEAKKAASLNVKSSNGASPKKGNWEDTLREVGNRLYG